MAHSLARSAAIAKRRFGQGIRARPEPADAARTKSGWCPAAGSTISGSTVPEEGKALGGFSLTHWLVVLLVVLILFGAGKLPRLMGDFAKGIKNFKTSLKDDEVSETALAGSSSSDDRKPAESR
jgi:sec-independent protein translocase protein TatA